MNFLSYYESEINYYNKVQYNVRWEIQRLFFIASPEWLYKVIKEKLSHISSSCCMCKLLDIIKN